MARPSSPSSKRSPKAPARRSVPSQAPRETLDVRPSWLEPSRAAPPPLQGAAADRDTLEVRPSWLEGDEEARADDATAERPSVTAKEKPTEKAKPKAPKKARTSLPMRRGRPSLDPAWEGAPNGELDRSALPPPLPTIEPTDPAPPSKRGKARG